MARDADSRSLIRRWENLEYGLQFLIAYPVLFVVITLLHLGPLMQPPGRSMIYAVFWALPAAILVVAATQNEARKRRERERAAADQHDAPDA